MGNILISRMFNHGKEIFGSIIVIFAFHWYGWFLLRLRHVLLMTELSQQLLNFSAKMLYQRLAHYCKINNRLRINSMLQTLLCLCCLNALNILLCIIVLLENNFVNGSTAIVGPGLFYSQLVGLLGWVISSLQGLYLNTGQHKQNKHIYTPNIHTLRGIRTHGHSVRASEDSSCLRPFDYRNRCLKIMHDWNVKHCYIVFGPYE
jgi:hypothetical protein